MKNRLPIALFLVITLTISRWAAADFHDWRINEVFSNTTGNIQFIEFHNVLEDGEEFLGGHQLFSNGGMITFLNNLPSDLTLNKFFLVATDDFANLPGAPTPDFTIPANFLNPNGDTINYTFVDSLTFDSLPTDGFSSLSRDLSTATNSPTNFAGVTGSIQASSQAVPLPPALAPGMIGVGLIALLSNRRGLLKFSRGLLASPQR